MKKKPKTKIKFNLFDYFWFLVGIVTSVAAIIVDHEHSLIYITLGIISLISAIFAELISAKGHRICYIFSFISAISYGIVAWMNSFYGGAISNICFFAPTAVVGFYLWGKNSNKKKEIVARKLSPTQIAVLFVVVIAAAIGLKFILEYFGGASTILDSISTVIIPIASILGVLRYRETWLLWFISDILILVMWTGVSDITVLTLRIFYPIVAIYGFFSWKKLLKKPALRRKSCKKQ